MILPPDPTRIAVSRLVCSLRVVGRLHNRYPEAGILIINYYTSRDIDLVIVLDGLSLAMARHGAIGKMVSHGLMVRLIFVVRLLDD